MRILHILEATAGGTRRHILDLLPSLQTRGFACTLAYSPLRNPAFAHDAVELERLGVATVELPMARAWGGAGDAAAWLSLQRHIRQHGYDIVHCHSTKAGILGRLALPGVKAPRLIYTPHCVAFDTTLPIPQRRAARLMERLLAPRTARFIAVSRHERSVLLRARLGTDRNVQLVYNGIDLDAFDQVAGEPTKPNGEFIVGSFGRLTRQKNQATLLQAAALARPQVPGIRLLLVGGGEDEALLRRLAKQLKLADRVAWIGEVEEARSWYLHCDVVAQPSRWEGCPYSVLEAMAARRAVVAANVGGVPDLLVDARNTLEPFGLMCPPGSAQSLANHLISLARDSTARERLGEAARERVAACFTLEQMVEQTAQIYREAVE